MVVNGAPFEKLSKCFPHLFSQSSFITSVKTRLFYRIFSRVLVLKFQHAELSYEQDVD